MNRSAAPLLALLLVTACSQPDNAAGAGGVSAGEVRALDDAAQMVQDQQIPPAALPAPQNPPPASKPAAPVPKAAVKPAG